MDEIQEQFILTLYCCMFEGCTKEYKNKFNLKRHIQTTHFKRKAFQCKTCLNTFVSKQNLAEHMFIHSGIKPYKCTYCGKKFRQVSQLCFHKRKHRKNYTQSLIISKQIEKDQEINTLI